VVVRPSPTEALKFSVVKVVYSALDPDAARGIDASFVGGSILQRNQKAKN
jgi:hypothetical protein